MPEPELDGEVGADRLEDVHAGERRHQLDDPRGRVLAVEDVEPPGPVLERRLAGPLREGRARLHLPTKQVSDERPADADLGRHEEARGEPALRGRHPDRLELHDEVSEDDLALEAVRLPKAVVIEHHVRALVEQLLHVVAERRAGVAVLHEVARGAGEHEPARELRDRRDPVHAVAGLGRARQEHLAGAERRDHAPQVQAGQQLVERAFFAVRPEKGHEPVERREEHRPPSDPSTTPRASGVTPGVRNRVWWERRTFEHAREGSTARGLLDRLPTASDRLSAACRTRANDRTPSWATPPRRWGCLWTPREASPAKITTGSGCAWPTPRAPR